MSFNRRRDGLPVIVLIALSAVCQTGCAFFRAESRLGTDPVRLPNGLTFSLWQHEQLDALRPGVDDNFRRVIVELHTEGGGGISRVVAQTDHKNNLDLGELDLYAASGGRQVWVAQRRTGSLLFAGNFDQLRFSGAGADAEWLTPELRAYATRIADVSIPRRHAYVANQ
ncbi:MAG: hypothetical protein ACKVS9_13340 [Phycisphaerae bacterium]